MLAHVRPLFALADQKPLDALAERELARRWAAGDAAAGKRLVEASLPFVVTLAKEFRRWDVPMEDLVQQGTLGLLTAAARFDPERECRLVTYAAPWIRAEIRSYCVRSYRIVRIGTTLAERRAIREVRRNAVSDAAELAARTGLPEERCRALYALLTRRDSALETGDAHGELPDAAPTPEDRAGADHDRARLRAVLDEQLAMLSPRERHIVERRFLSDEPATLDALGRELGVSGERVRQLEARAVAQLKSALSPFAELIAA